MSENPNHKPEKEAVIMLNGSSTVAGTEDGSQYHCPITGLEMNGRYKFIFFLTCGCVMSDTRLFHFFVYFFTLIVIFLHLKPFGELDVRKSLPECNRWAMSRVRTGIFKTGLYPHQSRVNRGQKDCEREYGGKKVQKQGG